MIDPTAYIHPFAYVDETIDIIGAETRIWQFASVVRNSIIGRDCVIANCALVDASTLGNDVRVSSCAVIFPGSEIWNNVFIGPGVVLCNDFWPSTEKDGWDYDALLGGKATSIQINPRASIFAGAKIMPGITIGARARVAADAIVNKDVPDDCLYGRDGSIEAIRGAPERLRTVKGST